MCNNVFRDRYENFRPFTLEDTTHNSRCGKRNGEKFARYSNPIEAKKNNTLASTLKILLRASFINVPISVFFPRELP